MGAPSPTLGSFIRKAREDRGVSLRQVADQLGVSAACLSRLENDHPRPVGAETLAKLFDRLGLDRWEGFRLAGVPDPHLMAMITRPSRSLVDLLLEGHDATDEAWARARRAVRRSRKKPWVSSGFR